MGIPESEKQHHDLVDLIIEASHVKKSVSQPDGSVKEELQIDPESIYWGTRIVGANTFARFVYELKEFQSLAKQCFNFMSVERANTLGLDILSLVQSWRYSIDSKSSESIRDKQNAAMTLIDKVSRNKQEKVYTMKEETRKSLMDGFLGREEQKDED